MNGRCQGFYCAARYRACSPAPGGRLAWTSDVLVVGAPGPAGLPPPSSCGGSASGASSSRTGSGPGGVPRHSRHTGYGLRDLRRVLTGPAYARTLTGRCGAGAEIRHRVDRHGALRDDGDGVGGPARGESRRSRPRPCCWPPGAGSAREPPGWSPATGRQV